MIISPPSWMEVEKRGGGGAATANMIDFNVFLVFTILTGGSTQLRYINYDPVKY